MNERTVRVVVVEKDVHGSVTQENKYSDDTLLEVRDWLDQILAKIPEDYRGAAKIEVDSVGGYEGEHHTEITVYYDRPENDKEIAARLREERAAAARQEAKERAAFEALKRKYEK